MFSLSSAESGKLPYKSITVSTFLQLMKIREDNLNTHFQIDNHLLLFRVYQYKYQ